MVPWFIEHLAMFALCAISGGAISWTALYYYESGRQPMMSPEDAPGIMSHMVATSIKIGAVTGLFGAAALAYW